MRGRLLHEEVLVNLDIADLYSYIQAGPMQFFGGARRCPYLPPVVVKKTVPKRNQWTRACGPALLARTFFVVYNRELGT